MTYPGALLMLALGTLIAIVVMVLSTAVFDLSARGIDRLGWCIVGVLFVAAILLFTWAGYS